jgi:hypothetical protein
MKSSIVIALLCAALGGTYAFILLAAPYLIQQTSASANVQANALSVMRRLVTTGNMLTYASVTSVDPVNGTLDVQYQNPFDRTAGAIPVRIRVEEPAYIARQELIGNNGVYDSLSQEVVSTLSSIKAGDHVAVLIDRNPDGSLSSHYLLFGNPL